jgi:hypothetical protein
MLAAQIAGDRIQILQLPILIPIRPAFQKSEEGFLRQIFRGMFVMKMKIQISENLVILVFRTQDAPSFLYSLHSV